MPERKVDHFSPTYANTLKFCPKLHCITYDLRRGPIDDPQDAKGRYKLYLGSAYHNMAKAVDLGLSVGDELRKWVTKEKSRPTFFYLSDQPLLNKAVEETTTVLQPAYERYMEGSNYETICCEKTFNVEIGGVPIKAVPDKVVRSPAGQIWVVERKTGSYDVSKRDDESRFTKKMDRQLQTTCYVIAAEIELGEPVVGVFLERVTIARKRVKDWPHDPMPQEINRDSKTHPGGVRISPWRPAPKSVWAKGEVAGFLHSCMEEIEWRKRTNNYMQPNYNSCPNCKLQRICSEEALASELLVDLGPRE